MALARALTKRAKRTEAPAPLPTREGSVRFPTGTIQRGKISLPTELLSTTNVLALNAPDIRSISASSSNSSLRSGEDSDFSHLSHSFIDSPLTSAETSSIESSPVTPEPHYGHTSFLKEATPARSATVSGMRSTSAGSDSSIDIPAIPQRAESHSKKAHEHLARKRSMSRLSPPPTAMPTTTTASRTSVDFFRASVDPSHPFGKELAQVNEVAEDFGASAAVLDEEEQIILNQGLRKFGVEDYVMEIQGLFGGVFEDQVGQMAWI